jgi:hypothetical protein
MDTKSHLSSKFRSRAPLSERSNTTSPASARWVRDSDESVPSHHSSIFDAGCKPYGWDMAKVRSASPRPIKILPPNQPTEIRLEDLQSESPLSRLGITPFLYGNGTELHPITEQQSFATLRTASYSTSDLSSVMPRSAGSRTQIPSVQAKSRLRRKTSFSLDDLGHLEQYQAASLRLNMLGPISSFSPPVESEGYAPAQDLHKYPYSPPYPPPARVCSPPDELANHTIEDLSRNFRGQRSGHGNMRTHPWVRLVQGTPLGTGLGCNPTGRSSSEDENGRGTTLWTCKRCHRPADAPWSL